MTSRDVDPIERMKARFRLMLDHYTGFAIALGFCLTAGAMLFVVTSQTSPVRRTDQLTGAVEAVTTGPASPKAAIGRGFYYVYDVQLDDGSRIRVRGHVERPMVIGQRIVVNRQRRENGRVTYHLPGPAGFGL